MTIRQGGPQVNHTQLLLAGRLDFNITGNSFLALNFVKENIPFRAVAAVFQKDPAVLIAHPGEGNDSFAALKGKPIMISADTRVGWWSFLKAKYGYTDSQIRPYTFNLAPFLAEQAGDPARLPRVRTVLDQAGGAFRPRGDARRRCRLPGLLQPDRDLGREDRASSRTW